MSEDIGFEEQLRLEALEKEENDKKRTRVDEDGTIFEWDDSKRAWFPKIDNNFIAEYQMNYGVGDKADKNSNGNGMNAEEYKQYCLDYWKQYYNKGDKDKDDDSASQEAPEEMKEEDLQAWANYYNSQEYRDWYAQVYGAGSQNEDAASEEKAENETESKGDKKEDVEEGKDKPETETKGKKRKKEPPKWFEMDSEKNTHVYVQNLPESTTDEEFKELMTKVGMIMFDPITRKPKLKLYRDENGKLKGDGRCCYIKSESVDLALQILDGYNFKGNILTVEKAQFELKGDFNPTKRRKLTKNEKKRAQVQHEKLFAWLPEKSKFIRSNRERVLVIKNAFVVEDFDNLEYLDVLRSRVRQECSRFGGVKKITIFDNNKEGVVKVLFCNAEEVDAAVPYLNGRIFQNRVITAEVWDGRSRYENKETTGSLTKRDKQWSAFLTGGNAEGQTDAEPNTEGRTDAEPNTEGQTDAEPNKEAQREAEETLPDDGTTSDQQEMVTETEGSTETEVISSMNDTDLPSNETPSTDDVSLTPDSSSDSRTVTS